MLFYNTVDSKTLELLKQLQSEPILKNLRLVGGTSLALQLGHRISVDIDLFGNIEGDEHELTEVLRKFDEVKTLKNSKNIHIYLINGIKVDLVNYSYPWLQDDLTIEGIKLASREDIAAMKLAAVTGRGSKKDFFDINLLLLEFSLAQMLTFYNTKYADGSEFLVLKSLCYFDDADQEEDPVMLSAISWEEIKTSITGIHKAYMESLS